MKRLRPCRAGGARSAAAASLSRIVNGLTLALAALAVTTAVTLAVATALMHSATTRLADATIGLQAAQEIEVNLLVHNLRSYLWLAGKDPANRAVRDQAIERLNAWLLTAREHAGDEEELRVIDEVETAVRAHLDTWAGVEAAGVDALVGMQGAMGTLEPAYRVADRLIELNTEQAAASLEESRRLNVVVDAAASLLVLFIAGLVGVATFLLRRWLYRPLLEIRAAIRSYTAGEREARAGTDYPRELADVAMDFNELAERLEQEQRERLLFVGAVAHDLKNPLAALKVAASIRVDPGNEEARARRISLIRRQIDRMERMLGDFLDLSRLESGHLDLRLEPVDVTGIAKNSVELFAGTTERHRLEVSAPKEPVVARGDRARIEQVLDNLLSNAIKYSPDGGPIEVRVGRRNGAVLLEVQDSGPGIAPEDRETIFEPYRRLKTASGKPGIGLGLAVTRRLVEAHGGRIWVESARDRGAIFRVELPAGTFPGAS